MVGVRPHYSMHGTATPLKGWPEGVARVLWVSWVVRHGALVAVTSVETVACKGWPICLPPLKRVRSALGLLFDLCPGVFERYGSVEDEFVRC